MDRYLLLNVGCLECGVPTTAIKIFPTLDEIGVWFDEHHVSFKDRAALIAVGREEDPNQDPSMWWGGQDRYVIVDLTPEVT